VFPMDVTGTAQRQAWRDRVLPPAERVRPGLWSVPVPIPRNPLRYVLCYVFETRSGPVLVDPGWPADESWDALTAGLRQAGTEVAAVYGVLVTHAHLDHHGLASRIRAASGCWVAMHPAEERQLAKIRDVAAVTALNARWLDRCGVPPAEQERLFLPAGRLRDLVDLAPDRLLDDGERADVPGWEVTALWTPGHTPGHLCFVAGGTDVLLTGDHLLPRITPNISAYGDDDNPLDDYLGALSLLPGYDAREALPGHEYRFRGIAERAGFIQAHHQARLDEVAARLAAQPGATAWEIAQELEWSRSWAETTGYLRRAALAETIAHLRSLRQSGRAGRREPAAGTDPGGGRGEPHGGPERWFPAAGEAGDSAANNAG
jgi:glyoxylase-like metal-dependent hydrolase (beta-lactamase superfamily II)